MPKPKVLRQFNMSLEIFNLVKKKSHVKLIPGDIGRALTRKYNRDPGAFDSESSRDVVVRDIADSFIARIDEAQKNRSEKRSPDGDVTTYPPGYEYSVLIASQIRTQIECIREQIWGTREIPFAVYEEAETWIFAQNNRDRDSQRGQPKKIELHLELVFDGDEDSYAYMQDINKFPNREEKRSFETWLNESGKALRSAISHDAWVSSDYGPFLKLESRSEVRRMRFGSTTVLRGQDSPGGVKTALVRGGYMEHLLTQCAEIAEEKAPGWTADDVFTYLVLGYLPLSPVEATLNYSGGVPSGFTYTFSYPALDKTLLNTHKEFMKGNHENRLGYFKAYPKPLTEHELNLLDIVYNMPLDSFTWAERLEAYLKRFEAEIAAGLSPDLGLGKDRTKNNDDKWNNASRNLNRDYRNALKKLGWNQNM